MKSLPLAGVIIAAILVQACGGGTDAAVDTAATYESYGASFEPAAAIPAQAVLAEAAPYIGKAVLLEGVLKDGCAPGTCWMMLEGGTDKTIRVFLPQTPDGSFAFSVPESVAGRRAVVRGSLLDSTEIRATGVMVEKVRS